MTRSKLVAAALLAAACDGPPAAPGGGTGTSGGRTRYASGSLAITRPDSSQVRIAIDDCWSGQMLSFYGVEVFDTDHVERRLRVVEDPVDGTRLVLVGLVPSRPRIVVEPGACTRLESRIEMANSSLNDIRSLRGRVAAECALPDGAGRLSADVTLLDCSFDNRVRGP